MSKSFSRKPFFITLPEWSQIQNIKKEKKIMEIESLLVIQNSKDHIIFNSIIKKLVRINIFDLSRISYLIILFLSPYIEPHLKELLNHDPDIPESIQSRLYENETPDYLPLLDKTIYMILELILNHIITLELFLNIQVLILYLNLQFSYSNLAFHPKPPIPFTTMNETNIILYKITNLVEIAKNNIPSSALSLLIMKIINKLGTLNTNFLNDTCIIENLEKEYLDAKITDMLETSRIIDNLHNDFIIQIMKLCDTGTASDVPSNNCIHIWNTSKNYIVNILLNSTAAFKIGLDILLIHLVKEQPELESRASCISNSIINFLEMEINSLDTKLNI
jgi:hypothetical protein